ncbi:hypothetical protein ENBRE01_3347, partial [Enteropsectra breve]
MFLQRIAECVFGPEILQVIPRTPKRGPRVLVENLLKEKAFISIKDISDSAMLELKLNKYNEDTMLNPNKPLECAENSLNSTAMGHENISDNSLSININDETAIFLNEKYSLKTLQLIISLRNEICTDLGPRLSHDYLYEVLVLFDYLDFSSLSYTTITLLQSGCPVHLSINKNLLFCINICIYLESMQKASHTAYIKNNWKKTGLRHGVTTHEFCIGAVNEMMLMFGSRRYKRHVNRILNRNINKCIDFLVKNTYREFYKIYASKSLSWLRKRALRSCPIAKNLLFIKRRIPNLFFLLRYSNIELSVNNEIKAANIEYEGRVLGYKIIPKYDRINQQCYCALALVDKKSSSINNNIFYLCSGEVGGSCTSIDIKIPKYLCEDLYHFYTGVIKIFNVVSEVCIINKAKSAYNTPLRKRCGPKTALNEIIDNLLLFILRINGGTKKSKIRGSTDPCSEEKNATPHINRIKIIGSNSLSDSAIKILRKLPLVYFGIIGNSALRDYLDLYRLFSTPSVLSESMRGSMGHLRAIHFLSDLLSSHGKINENIIGVNSMAKKSFSATGRWKEIDLYTVMDNRQEVWNAEELKIIDLIKHKFMGENIKEDLKAKKCLKIRNMRIMDPLNNTYDIDEIMSSRRYTIYFTKDEILRDCKSLHVSKNATTFDFFFYTSDAPLEEFVLYFRNEKVDKAWMATEIVGIVR